MLLAFVFGAAVGILMYWVIEFSSRRGRAALELSSESIPAGVVEVVQALESGGIILDRSNTVLQASRGAQLLGLVVGGQIAHKSIVAVINEARAEGQPVSRSLEIPSGRFADGQSLSLHVRAAPLGVKYMLLLVDDHTDEERLNSVRRDFIANVSHELKTPVGAIALLADAIQAAEDDLERVRGFTKRIHHEAERLGSMTKEIIDLTRIQAENPLDDPDLVPIAEVIEEAVDANRVAAEAKQIRISARVIDQATVLGDRAMLTMAVKNLVDNAIVYSAEGTHVGVGVRTEGELVEVSVTDKGVGIDVADQQRVFERFYRVDPARSRRTGGSGLGLSIVKHVVQSHRGTVSLWSKPGQGSTFTIRLPFVAANEEESR